MPSFPSSFAKLAVYALAIAGRILDVLHQGMIWYKGTHTCVQCYMRACLICTFVVLPLFQLSIGVAKKHALGEQARAARTALLPRV